MKLGSGNQEISCGIYAQDLCIYFTNFSVCNGFHDTNTSFSVMSQNIGRLPAHVARSILHQYNVIVNNTITKHTDLFTKNEHNCHIFVKVFTTTCIFS